jgi:hypothetical protein
MAANQTVAAHGGFGKAPEKIAHEGIHRGIVMV